jgi:hypothetical protein
MFLGTETDKRKHFRADVRFVVAYGRMNNDSIVDRDVSQTKNISESGMAFTTSHPFDPQTSLMLQIKLPVASESVQVTATVVESKEIRPNFMYFTRVSFSEINDQNRRAIQQTVDYYARKHRLQN